MSNFTSGLLVLACSICQDLSFDMQYAHVMSKDKRIIVILRMSDFVSHIQTLLSKVDPYNNTFSVSTHRDLSNGI
jgi:hypothetical protein